MALCVGQLEPSPSDKLFLGKPESWLEPFEPDRFVRDVRDKFARNPTSAMLRISLFGRLWELSTKKPIFEIPVGVGLHTQCLMAASMSQKRMAMLSCFPFLDIKSDFATVLKIPAFSDDTFADTLTLFMLSMFGGAMDEKMFDLERLSRIAIECGLSYPPEILV